MLIAIDPGIKGGLCVDGSVYPLPFLGESLDCKHLLRLFRYSDARLAIEEQSYRPGQGGVVTTLTNYGRILGIAESVSLQPFIIRPQAWKKAVLGGRYSHDKAGAILFCQEHYPKINLVLPGCRKPHDGMADALCIYHFAKDKRL